MIDVQDRIEVASDRLDALLQLFREEYMPAAAGRGLHFSGSLVSPPVRLRRSPLTLWLRWQVADAGAWWAMRAQSGVPQVAAFWAKVDALCVSRERVYLADAAAAELPQPVDASAYAVATCGFRETAQLRLRENIDDTRRSAFETRLREAAAALPGLQAAALSPNYAPEYAAGHYTWDLLYPDRDSADNARESAAWKQAISAALAEHCVACHALALQTLGAGVRSSDLVNGIKRTAYFRLLPDTATDSAQRFERDLLEMTEQIPEILNWRLSRTVALPWNTADCAPWTYVWEQEYASLDDLLGPYMAHPHHWAHIDRWFDPESGAQAVDVNLSHAFCHLQDSIIGREAVKPAV